MRKSAALLTLLLQASSTLVFADAADYYSTEQNFKQETASDTIQDVSLEGTQSDTTQTLTPFQAFTGKVTKNKVRLRAQPNLDSPILRELSQGDMLIVIGETEDFYAVQPPTDIKAYVFRTYVLDNVIEANKVNVRLEPDLDSPIIAQLYAGDHVDGTISPLNSKWLEITPPSTARFFIAKDYVEKLGNPDLMSAIERRRDEVNILLNSTYLVSQTEIQKPFPEINLDGVYGNFNKIISDYPDFPEQVARARELLSMIQDNYLQKKIAYLETKTKMTQEDWQNKNSQLNQQMKTQQEKLAKLEQQLQKERSNKTAAKSSNQNNRTSGALNDKMALWIPSEQSMYEVWAQQNNGSKEDFYQQQRDNAVAIKGIIEPYTRVIKNKPGDYVLVSQSTNLPVAYLYSTQINLQDAIGREVTVYGAARNNNNFAFPAYFVLSLE